MTAAERGTRSIVCALYGAAVVFSLAFAELKYEALGFHSRDYPFYFQFATRLLAEDGAPRTYTLNPDGYNVLFFNGTDGAESLHQSLHLEPIKYLYAPLYAATGSRTLLFGFVAVVFFLPVLYIVFVIPLDSRETRAFVVLVTLAYVSYPASLAASSFDLRPYVFLAPFFAMSVISVAFRRPVAEVSILFGTMFLAREEAIIFGLIVMAYAVTALHDSPQRRTVAWSLGLIWTAAVIATLSFFVWTGYRNTLASRMTAAWTASAIPTWLALAAGAAIVVAGLLLLASAWRLYQKLSGARMLQVVVYCAVFPPLLFQFVRERGEQMASSQFADVMRALLAPRYALHLVSIVVLTIIVWNLTASKAIRRVLVATLGAVVVLGGVVSLASPYGLRAQIGTYRDRATHAAAVLALRDVIDDDGSAVLADYSTYQAFADYSQVFVYQRLPLTLAEGQSRFFPANRSIVQALVDERVEYVVIARENADDVRQFTSHGNLRTSMLFENAQFVAFAISRPGHRSVHE